MFSISTTPALAVTLSTLWWFTFSIYAIETHDLKNSKFSSTSSLTSTSFFSEEE
jgi:hypothetical protein